jgi:hypothetical protein
VTRRNPDEERNLIEAGNLGRGEPIPVFFETLEHRVKHPERGLFRKCRKGGPLSLADRSPSIFGCEGIGE